MSKKPVTEHDKVADKLRGSLNIRETVNAGLGSPITPLQTRSSGLTSAATTTTSSSCGSSSSGTVKARDGQIPVTRKSVSSLPIPSAAQSKSSITSSAAQSKSSSTSSAAQSSKSTAPSAVQSASSSQTSKSSSSPTSHAAQSGSGSGSPKGILKPSGKSTVLGPGASTMRSVSFSPATPTTSSSAKNKDLAEIMSNKPVTEVADKLRGSLNIKPDSVNAGLRSPITPLQTRPSGLTSAATTTTSSSCSSSSSTMPRVSFSPETPTTSNPEEVKKAGNDLFSRGCFTEALKLYDRAISLKPANAIYHSNRAAALSNLDRIGEAVNACEVAIKLDPKFVNARHRLGVLLFRLGQIDNARRHFYPKVEKKLQIAYNCIERCTDARRHGEWNQVLSEATEAMASGADYSPQLGMCKVEALLKLERLDDAQSLLASVPKVEPFPASFSKTRFFDMACEAYVLFVKSQIELALGRFENAVTAAKKASEIDPGNREIGALYKRVRVIIMARDRGHKLYESETYSEASVAYTEGIAYDRFNATLLYHRADCFFKVGMWKSSIEDCDRALLILPSYTKPRIQRAASYCKLERWDRAVSDYEILSRAMPYDKEIAESLFQARIALKKSEGEVVLNMETGGEVEEISSVEELKTALTRPGFSVVYFFKTSDKECVEMCAFMDELCIRYPSLHFLKVEIEKCREVGDAENVKAVPTIKIYKVWSLINVFVCPSKEALERSVRHIQRNTRI